MIELLIQIIFSQINPFQDLKRKGLQNLYAI